MYYPSWPLSESEHMFHTRDACLLTCCRKKKSFLQIILYPMGRIATSLRACLAIVVVPNEPLTRGFSCFTCLWPPKKGLKSTNMAHIIAPLRYILFLGEWDTYFYLNMSLTILFLTFFWRLSKHFKQQYIATIILFTDSWLHSAWK